MTGLSAPWPAILLSSVIVFVASSLIHMVLPVAQERLPEAAERGPGAGRVASARHSTRRLLYPRPSDSREMRSPEFAERCARARS